MKKIRFSRIQMVEKYLIIVRCLWCSNSAGDMETENTDLNIRFSSCEEDERLGDGGGGGERGGGEGGGGEGEEMEWEAEGEKKGEGETETSCSTQDGEGDLREKSEEKTEEENK